MSVSELTDCKNINITRALYQHRLSNAIISHQDTPFTLNSADADIFALLNL